MRNVGDADIQARWYYRLKLEYARARAEGRTFVNPVEDRVLLVILERVVKLNKVTNGIVYLQITRGIAPRDLPRATSDRSD